MTHDQQGAHEIVAFDVSAEGKLSSRRTFAVIDSGVPDGFRVDVDENIWTSAADGALFVLRRTAKSIGKRFRLSKLSPMSPRRLKRNRLLITAATSLYLI